MIAEPPLKKPAGGRRHLGADDARLHACVSHRALYQAFAPASRVIVTVRCGRCCDRVLSCSNVVSGSLNDEVPLLPLSCSQVKE